MVICSALIYCTGSRLIITVPSNYRDLVSYLPLARRLTSYSRSSADKNIAVSGLLGRYQAAKAASKTEGAPSMINNLGKQSVIMIHRYLFLAFE